MQYLPGFVDWLISLSVMSSRFIYVTTCCKVAFSFLRPSSLQKKNQKKKEPSGEKQNRGACMRLFDENVN